MGEGKLVTVIVTVFNKEKYLRQCLDSVTGQTEGSLEIICVNDGSTDGCGEILMEYEKKDPRIRVITQKNAGLSAARNTGIEAAGGKYLYFMDADDYLEPDGLSAAVQRMEKEQLDMLLMDVVPFAETDAYAEECERYKKFYTRTGDYPGIYTGPALLSAMEAGGDYLQAAWLYVLRTAFVKENVLRFYPGILQEDNLFTFQCLLSAGRAGYEKKLLYHRRLADDSIMTKKKTFANISGYFRAYREMSRCLEERSRQMRGAETAAVLQTGDRQEKDLSGQETAAFGREPEVIRADALQMETGAAAILRNLLGNIRRQYGRLDEEEKEKYKEFSPYDRLLFETLVIESSEEAVKAVELAMKRMQGRMRWLDEALEKTRLEKKEAENGRKMAEKELARIKESRAYRTLKKTHLL
ncbi:MAG: glycosyltransferase [Blautia sp.]|nr:glycosyltransferase [Blautia sp.]